MLLSYNNLITLINVGVINADLGNVNSASIDITLGDYILVENTQHPMNKPVDISKKETISTQKVSIRDGYTLQPGEFILATSVETFNLPSNISAEYKLKSSMARCGLEHLNAGWCDAGWFGSNLTLELKNLTSHHRLFIKAGMKIGQIVFFQHPPVPEGKDYATRGRYNNQDGVTAGKGVE